VSNTVAPLSKLTIRLHWLIAAAMISLFAVGQYMTNTETWSLYPTHKSMGMLVLILVLPRIVLRVIEGWPTPVAEAPPFQERIAKIVHWALILATVAMPLSGMLMSGAGGHGLYIFGLELGIGSLGHEIWGKVLALSVVLHVAGALKHHIKDKDATLTRMLGK